MLRALRWLPVLGLAVSGLAHAQAPAWPTKPVRLIVPVAPGGATDMLARAVGQALAHNLGQPFVVEGKPGAAGSIASVEVARAPADGHTLLVATSSTHSVAPALSNQLQYDPVADFTPIAMLAEANNIVLASPKLEVKDMKELFALARQKPGYVNYVSSGKGSFGHLAFMSLQAQAGISMTHVPYKGTSAAIPDMMAGNVHLAADAISSALPLVKDGRLRALAVTGPRRSPLAPDIPTVAESGVPGYSVLSWFGLYAPRGLPPQLARRINEEVNKVLRSPEMAARFAALGIEPGRGSPEEFAAAVAADTARWSKVVKEQKIRMD